MTASMTVQSSASCLASAKICVPPGVSMSFVRLLSRVIGRRLSRGGARPAAGGQRDCNTQRARSHLPRWQRLAPARLARRS